MAHVECLEFLTAFMLGQIRAGIQQTAFLERVMGNFARDSKYTGSLLPLQGSIQRLARTQGGTEGASGPKA